MRLLLTALLLTLAAPSLAAGKDTPASQFLDKSVVTYPRAVGPYTLYYDGYDPAKWQFGVTTEYSIEGQPKGTYAAVYVYPYGRNEASVGVKHGMDQIEAAVRYQVEHQVYTDATFGERTSFVVDVPRATILDSKERRQEVLIGVDDAKSPDVTPPPAKATVAPATTDPLAAALAASKPAPITSGQRQIIGYTEKGVAMRTAGYVFYRHLFLFKVRVKAPADQVDAAAFEAMADAAARRLVPAMDVQNFGDCGTMRVSMVPESADKEADVQKNALELIAAMGRIERENCANQDGGDERVPAGSGQHVIVYPAGTWD